jgi:hypothetical protein
MQQLPSTSGFGSFTRTFSLDGIWPEHTQLLLDSQRGLALLLRREGEESLSLWLSLPLAPSAARLFLALLQAYPGYSSYRALFAALYPEQSGATPQGWETEWVRRPIRRAARTLAPTLQQLGLATVSVRGRGYLLTSATDAPKESSESLDSPLGLQSDGGTTDPQADQAENQNQRKERKSWKKSICFTK